MPLLVGTVTAHAYAGPARHRPQYEAQIVNFSQGAGEHLIARLLDGRSNRFVVQYSVRGAVTMTPERRAEWIEKLMAIQIVGLP